MRIIVTGASGRIGRLAVRELVDRGHDVLATDRVPPPERVCPFLPAELTDAAAVYAVLRGAEAVLHLGAIPGPGAHPGPTIFHNNVAGTYCVVEAAATLGVRRLVFASTVFALGWHPEPDGYWPQYVPVDEEHPLTPFEAYGLSKQVGEALCATACRRTGMSAVSLRIMNVIQPDGYGALPWPAPSPQARVRFVMWPYVDARDAARACRLALEAETAGHEAVYIAAADTRFDAPTEARLRSLAPESVEIRAPLPERASVICTGKAKALLDWEAEYGWQLHPGE